MMRLLHRLLRYGIWTSVLLLVLAVGLLWLAASELALRWAAGAAVEAVEARGGRLEIEGLARGGFTGVRVARLRYADQKVTIEARDAGVFLSAGMLVRRGWVVGDAMFGELRIVPTPGGEESSSLPERIDLPMRLDLRRAQVHRLVVEAGGTSVRLDDLRFAYRYDGTHHRATIVNVVTEWAQARGDLTLTHQRPFGIAGRFEVAPVEPSLGRTTVEVAGDLDALGVGIEASLHGAPAVAAVSVLPFAAERIVAARLRLDGLEVQRIAPAAPTASLRALATATIDRNGAVQGAMEIENTAAGALAARKIPVRRAALAFARAADHWSFADLTIEAPGIGRVTGRGSYRDAVLQADLATVGLDVRGLHPPLRRTALRGAAHVEASAQGVEFRGELTEQGYRLSLRGGYAEQRVRVSAAELTGAAGTLRVEGEVTLGERVGFAARGRLAGLDPSRLGDFPAATLNGEFSATGAVDPLRVDAKVQLGASRLRGQSLGGSGRFAFEPGRVGGVDARFSLGTASLAAQGAFGRSGDQLVWSADVPDLRVLAEQARGSLRGAGTLVGTFDAPALALKADGKAVRWGDAVSVETLQVEASLAEGGEGQLALAATARRLETAGSRVERLRIEGSGVRARHELRLDAASGPAELSARARGALGAGNAWSGEILALDARGPLPVRLAAPARLEVSSAGVLLGATQLAVDRGRLMVDRLDTRAGRLASTGSMEAMPVTVLRSFFAIPDALAGLRFGGRWNVVADRTVDGELALWREQGDIALSADPPLAAGLQTLRLDAKVQTGEVQMQAQAESRLLGRAEATASTRLAQRDGRWGLPGDAPLQVRVRAELGSLGWTRALLGDEVVLEGRAELAVDGNGTVAAPGLAGKLVGSGLAVRVPEQGVELTDGRLAGRWEGTRLSIEPLAFAAGGGRVEATGIAGFEAGRPSLRLDVSAERATLVSRPDRLVVASGKGRVALSDGRVNASGNFVADRAVIELAREDKPAPSSDVRVVGRTRPPESPLRVLTDLQFDLGKDFLLRGRGLDARLEGTLRMRSDGKSQPTLHGGVRVAKGTFAAFGQQVVIERGVVNFDGAPDNPALDILAVRKGLAVEAGVAVGGTARFPRIRLVSTPSVSDAEKLAWLTLGHGLDQSGRNEAAVLQAAAQALFARGEGTGVTGGLARTFGLDELTFAGRGDAGEGIVTFGKRLAANVYVGYERGLTGAVSVMKIQLDLSRRWSVQARAGSENAVDLFYTIGFR